MSRIRSKCIDLIRGMRRATTRFPLGVFFAVCLTAVSIVLNHTDPDTIADSTEFFLYWYPITAMLLSVALTLWYEERCSRTSLTVCIIAELLWLCIMILLSRKSYNMGYAPGLYILMGIVAILLVAVPTLPFIGRKTGMDGDSADVPFWNFTLHCAWAGIVALIISGILCGSLCLLLLSIEKLFGIDVTSDLYEDIVLVSFLLVAPLLAFQGIPDGQRKYDILPVRLPELTAKAFHYLFIPLTAAYIVTLYVYALRIVFTWELPQGWVSWPVSFSMFAVTGLFILAYPFLNKSEGSRLTLLITRIFPLLMLPLLVLMSIGIARRISEYGVSILRIYLVFFNLWSYVACVAMAFARHQRVMWIPLSAVLLFAVLSVFPFNVSTFVRDRMTASLDKILTASQWDGQPMDKGKYAEWLQSLDEETASTADSRLEYLKREFSKSQTEQIVNGDVWPGHFARTHSVADSEKEDVQTLSAYHLMPDSCISIPEGARTFYMVDCSIVIDSTDFSSDTLHLSVPNGSGTHAHFSIPLEDLHKLNDMNRVYDIRPDIPVCHKDDSGSYMLMLNSFDLTATRGEGNCYLRGVLFTLDSLAAQ